MTLTWTSGWMMVDDGQTETPPRVLSSTTCSQEGFHLSEEKGDRETSLPMCNGLINKRHLNEKRAVRWECLGVSWVKSRLFMACRSVIRESVSAEICIFAVSIWRQ